MQPTLLSKYLMHLTTTVMYSEDNVLFCRSTAVINSLICLSYQRSCSICGLLQYLIYKTDQQICSEGPACFLDNGIFQTTPGIFISRLFLIFSTPT